MFRSGGVNLRVSLGVHLRVNVRVTRRARLEGRSRRALLAADTRVERTVRAETGAACADPSGSQCEDRRRTNSGNGHKGKESLP